jgi:hypothetical protein
MPQLAQKGWSGSEQLSPLTRGTSSAMTIIASILWKRLDVRGHDACCIERNGETWTLTGTAVCLEEGLPTLLCYRVSGTSGWRAMHGHVSGWIGTREVDLEMTRGTDGRWAVNGVVAPQLGPDLDLDYGFTPATNLPQLRRLALREGEGADAPAAWLDVSTGQLTHLPQRYERRSDVLYHYVSPTAGYDDVLEVGRDGFIRSYPGLWEAEG